MVKKLRGALAKRIKPWAVVMLALALPLLSYYGVRGHQFLTYRAAEQRLSAQISQLSQVLGKDTPDPESLEAELEEARLKLEEASDQYDCEHRDHLVALVADAASDAGVHLSAVKVTKPLKKSDGEIRYDLQPLEISVSGSLADIFSFLNLLHLRAPTIEITEVSLDGLDDKPVAQILTAFYLQPQWATDKGSKQ